MCPQERQGHQWNWAGLQVVNQDRTKISRSEGADLFWYLSVAMRKYELSCGKGDNPSTAQFHFDLYKEERDRSKKPVKSWGTHTSVWLLTALRSSSSLNVSVHRLNYVQLCLCWAVLVSGGGTSFPSITHISSQLLRVTFHLLPSPSIRFSAWLLRLYKLLFRLSEPPPPITPHPSTPFKASSLVLHLLFLRQILTLDKYRQTEKYRKTMVQR